jgi:membrane-associated phospholipid phosphatase
MLFLAVALIGAAPVHAQTVEQANSLYRRTAANLRDVQETNLFLASAGLYAAGHIAGAPTLADIGLHTGEAILVAWGIGGVLKQVIGRPRPYVEGSDPYDFELGRGYRDAEYRSFPSLHAGGNFAAASALVSESRQRWPHAAGYIAPVAYGAASLVSLARMYENHHWASDVLLGRPSALLRAAR